MKADEFARQLGITKEGKYLDDTYVITLKDSNEYARMYTILDKAENVDLDTENMNLSMQSTIMNYLADEFDIELSANLNEDVYTISFTPAKED